MLLYMFVFICWFICLCLYATCSNECSISPRCCCMYQGGILRLHCQVWPCHAFLPPREGIPAGAALGGSHRGHHHRGPGGRDSHRHHRQIPHEAQEVSAPPPRSPPRCCSPGSSFPLLIPSPRSHSFCICLCVSACSLLLPFSVGWSLFRQILRRVGKLAGPEILHYNIVIFLEFRNVLKLWWLCCLLSDPLIRSHLHTFILYAWLGNHNWAFIKLNFRIQKYIGYSNILIQPWLRFFSI